MDSKNTTKLVSFVIPCYCSEKTLPAVVEEIDAAMEKLPAYRHEILMVNDCSRDHTWETIQNLCKEKTGRFGITFARNFGQHAALMAGIRATRGDIVVCLDDDGQTPADEVGKLLLEIEKGADVCYARYEHKKHSAFRNFGSWMNEKMAQWLLEKPADLYISSYFAMRRFVADEVCRYNNSYAYLPGLVLRSTKNIVNVDVNHRARQVGQSGYSFGKLLGLWLNGFTSFSVKPLRLATLLGGIFAGLAFVYGIYTIIKKLINPNVPVGFSAIMCAIIFFGGMLMLMVGLVGEYVGRTFISANNAPQFVIRDTTDNLEIHRTEAGIYDAEQKN